MIEYRIWKVVTWKNLQSIWCECWQVLNVNIDKSFFSFNVKIEWISVNTNKSSFFLYLMESFFNFFIVEFVCANIVVPNIPLVSFSFLLFPYHNSIVFFRFFFNLYNVNANKSFSHFNVRLVQMLTSLHFSFEIYQLSSYFEWEMRWIKIINKKDKKSIW